MNCYVCEVDLEKFSKRKHYFVGHWFVIDPPEAAHCGHTPESLKIDRLGQAPLCQHHRVCPWCFRDWPGVLKWGPKILRVKGSPGSGQKHKQIVSKLKSEGKYHPDSMRRRRLPPEK